MADETTIVLDGLIFPECPRWHDGKLWFADVFPGRIITIDAAGATAVAFQHEAPLAGIGWRTDGSLLFVSTIDRRLMRRDAAGGVTEVADLSAHEPVQLNDMTVDATGRAYIGGWGFDLNRGAKQALANVFLVGEDGRIRVASDGMRFPNGMVITPDGRTLVVAETTARCLTAFDIAADGSLSGRREWARLPVFPDGICLDAEGAIWVASPVSGECLRVREGGEITRKVAVPGKGVYACMLGGDDRRTLYLCTATGTTADISDGKTVGWIESISGDVAGAGRP
jgi:sugar lactone lactonase YvrE